MLFLNDSELKSVSLMRLQRCYSDCKFYKFTELMLNMHYSTEKNFNSIACEQQDH